MSIDGGLRPLFRERLKRGFQWTSIETGGTGRGTPDSEFCCGGVARWVEFKQTEGWACTLLPEQVGWHVARAYRGGTSLIATRRWHDGGPRRGEAVDELWVHEGRFAAELRAEGLRAAEPLLREFGGPAGWDWDRVRAVLLA